MEFFDCKTNKMISSEEAQHNENGVKIVCNPAEFFVYDFAQKNNRDISEIYNTLINADFYFNYYEKEGMLIAYFFDEYASFFEEEFCCDILENCVEIVERQFNDEEKTRFNVVLDLAFWTIDKIVIREAVKNEEEMSEKDVEFELIDRIYNERGFFVESDEEFLTSYVDEEFHEYFFGVEDTLNKMEYNLDNYVKNAFDFSEIAKKIADGIENGLEDDEWQFRF